MQSQLVACLRDAYETNGERRDEALGANALTFGTLTSIRSDTL